MNLIDAGAFVRKLGSSQKARREYQNQDEKIRLET